MARKDYRLKKSDDRADEKGDLAKAPEVETRKVLLKSFSRICIETTTTGVEKIVERLKTREESGMTPRVLVASHWVCWDCNVDVRKGDRCWHCGVVEPSQEV